jgi:8-oxo-dGTP pyrophosphatase MutT (NUDIX family)
MSASDPIPLSRIPNFDPRAVPVRAVDSHLPPVPPERLTAEALRQRFLAPPAWQPEVRAEPRFVQRQPAQAAVLVPLVMRPEPTLLLTQRAVQLRNHSGQIAFPGGRVDAADASIAAAALREAEEEVGLTRDQVEVLGMLPTYTTGTAFVITPVVALVRPGFTLKPNPVEVAEAFEVPLAFLLDPAHHRRHAHEFEGVVREWFSMPWQDGGDAADAAQGRKERFIWGATAGMLRNFYRFMAA